jgi:hypothetical protein
VPLRAQISPSLFSKEGSRRSKQISPLQKGIEGGLNCLTSLNELLRQDTSLKQRLITKIVAYSKHQERFLALPLGITLM